MCGAPVPITDQPQLRDALRILVDVGRKLKCVRLGATCGGFLRHAVMFCREDREKSGALTLESVELRFQLSSDGGPEKIKTPDRKQSLVFHTLSYHLCLIHWALQTWKSTAPSRK